MLWTVFIILAKAPHFLHQDGCSYIEAAGKELSKIQDRRDVRI